jgi:hypothetical protein
MSFFGFMSAPVSIPPVFDTTPCLEHLMEYEDCVIDVNSSKKELLMPSWPSLWPRLLDGKTNNKIDSRPKDLIWTDRQEKDPTTDDTPLTARQKQLLALVTALSLKHSFGNKSTSRDFVFFSHHFGCSKSHALF